MVRLAGTRAVWQGNSVGSPLGVNSINARPVPCNEGLIPNT